MNFPARLLTHAKLLGLALLLTLALAACGGSNDTLTVYSGRSETLVAPIIEQFTAETGIEVAVKYGGTAALAATLLEEGDATPADVFYAQEPGGLGAVQALFVKLDDGTLAKVPAWARALDGRWAGISGRARVLVYNPERLSTDELPASLEELTDPRWQGRVGWAPTNASLLTMVSGMRATWGEGRTLAWLEGMVANDTKVYPKNTPQVAAVAAGEIDIGLVNHYYLYRFLAEEGEDFPARNYHLPNGGPGDLVMVSGAAILKHSDNKDDARRFIDYLLSPTAQEYFAAETFEYPLIEGVPVHHLLTPLDEIGQPGLTPTDLMGIDVSQDLMRAAGALP